MIESRKKLPPVASLRPDQEPLAQLSDAVSASANFSAGHQGAGHWHGSQPRHDREPAPPLD
jgi:hypothetical protein